MQKKKAQKMKKKHFSTICSILSNTDSSFLFSCKKQGQCVDLTLHT